MKKVLISLLLVFVFLCSQAQEDKIKIEINSLEQKSRLAIVQKDSTTLRKLWSPTFMVNAPNNRVFKGGEVEMIMAGQINYTSYKGELEEILINGDLVITMGHEKVVPTMGNSKGGQTIERRYTHIWIRKTDSWQLIARHSSEVCTQ